MLLIKEPNADKLFVEIVQRMEKLEVKGDSVEHLFRIRMSLKSIIESIEDVPDEENKENEGGK